MTATRDGGMVIAFVPYDGSSEFPAARFTVLGLDSSACVRWRKSLRGEWPIARPVSVGADSILVASQRGRSRSAPRLRLNTLSASTGRVLRREDLSAPAALGGSRPTLVGDRRGNVAVLLSVPVGQGTSDCCTDKTVKLSRGARGTRWRRDLIARGESGIAAAARPDGRMVVAYALRGRLWVRTGTVAGRLRKPDKAGRLGGNFRSATVALADDGTIAAAWQSGTYSRPWRLRVAVRLRQARAFSRPTQLGYAAGERGTLLEGPAPALHIDTDRRVAVGFYAPTADAPAQARCVRSDTTGRFARPRPFTRHRPADLAGATTLQGHDVSAAMMLAAPDPDELGSTRVVVGRGCRARSTRLLAPAAGIPIQAADDAPRRIWLLTQPQSIDSSQPLMLTVTKPAR